MGFKTYCKLYAIPCGILVIGFLLYFVLFDSLNQYKHKQNFLFTITEKQDVHDEELLEQIRMHEELEAIKESANADFIKSTLQENLSRIHSSTVTEFHKTDKHTQTHKHNKQ